VEEMMSSTPIITTRRDFYALAEIGDARLVLFKFPLLHQHTIEHQGIAADAILHG
jgi:hypothetical protein